jgi:hypothetical protein
MEAVFIGIVDETGIDTGGVGAGGVDRIPLIPPETRKGSESLVGPWPVEPMAGGADAGGKIPRDRRAAISGFSGCGVELAEAIWGIWGIGGITLGIAGGGVGCWRIAVFLISSARVLEFNRFCKGWDVVWVGGVETGAGGGIGVATVGTAAEGALGTWF